MVLRRELVDLRLVHFEGACCGAATAVVLPETCTETLPLLDWSGSLLAERPTVVGTSLVSEKTEALPPPLALSQHFVALELLLSKERETTRTFRIAISSRSGETLI